MADDKISNIINNNLHGFYSLLAKNLLSETTNEFILLKEYPYQDIMFLKNFGTKTLNSASFKRTVRNTFPVVVFMNNNSVTSSELKEKGCIPLTRWKGMAITVKKNNKKTKSIEIVKVASSYRFRQWENVVKEVFHPSELKPQKLPYSRIYKNENIKLILGLYNKKPACSGAIFENNNSAGIYFIGTHTDFRGRGLATEFMIQLMNLTAKKTIVLQATQDGYKIYSKLGFKEYCNFDLYRFMPDE